MNEVYNKIEALKKANKVERLIALAKMGVKQISFTVNTPTSVDRVVQSVTLRDFKVRETKDGNFIVNGRNVAKELENDMHRFGKVNSLLKTRSKEDCIFRSYRVDRMIDGTISF